MQTAEVVLGVLRERGRKGLPFTQLYRQMFNSDLYLTRLSHFSGMGPIGQHGLASPQPGCGQWGLTGQGGAIATRGMTCCNADTGYLGV